MEFRENEADKRHLLICFPVDDSLYLNYIANHAGEKKKQTFCSNGIDKKRSERQNLLLSSCHVNQVALKNHGWKEKSELIMLNLPRGGNGSLNDVERDSEGVQGEPPLAFTRGSEYLLASLSCQPS